jgi:Ca2+/Na+ antiporter
MIAALAQFVLAALAIIVAGTFLTRTSDKIAEQTGSGRLLVGSLFLAGATSRPELSVDISAIRQGMPNLAWAISWAAAFLISLSLRCSISPTVRGAGCFRTPRLPMPCPPR